MLQVEQRLDLSLQDATSCQNHWKTKRKNVFLITNGWKSRGGGISDFFCKHLGAGRYLLFGQNCQGQGSPILSFIAFFCLGVLCYTSLLSSHPRVHLPYVPGSLYQDVLWKLLVFPSWIFNLPTSMVSCTEVGSGKPYLLTLNSHSLEVLTYVPLLANQV